MVPNRDGDGERTATSPATRAVSVLVVCALAPTIFAQSQSGTLTAFENWDSPQTQAYSSRYSTPFASFAPAFEFTSGATGDLARVQVAIAPECATGANLYCTLWSASNAGNTPSQLLASTFATVSQPGIVTFAFPTLTENGTGSDPYFGNPSVFNSAKIATGNHYWVGLESPQHLKYSYYCKPSEDLPFAQDLGGQWYGYPDSPAAYFQVDLSQAAPEPHLLLLGLITLSVCLRLRRRS